MSIGTILVFVGIVVIALLAYRYFTKKKDANTKAVLPNVTPPKAQGAVGSGDPKNNNIGNTEAKNGTVKNHLDPNTKREGDEEEGDAEEGDAEEDDEEEGDEEEGDGLEGDGFEGDGFEGDGIEKGDGVDYD